MQSLLGWRKVRGRCLEEINRETENWTFPDPVAEVVDPVPMVTIRQCWRGRMRMTHILTSGRAAAFLHPHFSTARWRPQGFEV